MATGSNKLVIIKDELSKEVMYIRVGTETTSSIILPKSNEHSKTMIKLSSRVEARPTTSTFPST